MVGLCLSLFSWVCGNARAWFSCCALMLVDLVTLLLAYCVCLLDVCWGLCLRLFRLCFV